MRTSSWRRVLRRWTRWLGIEDSRWADGSGPGEKVIVPPPLTEEQVEELLRSDYEKIDFYLMKRSL